MIFCVTGGRDHPPFRPFYEKLFLTRLKALYEPYNPVTELWHGGARGADTEAALWAKNAGLRSRLFRAEWGVFHRRAGIVRNERMADALGCSDDITLLIAFPGGVGTAHMWNLAESLGLNRIKYVEGMKQFPSYDSLLPF